MAPSTAPPLLWTTGHVEADGERIYYEVTVGADLAPEARTVVLGHGGAGSHAVWFQQVPALARRRRVVTWDTRGFGGSSFRTGRMDPATVAGDLAAVLDALQIAGPVHLVGQSMGGWWITAFVGAHPERVRSLTYTNTAGGVHTPDLDEYFSGSVVSRTRSESVVGGHFGVSRRFVERDPARAFLYQELNTLQDPPPSAVASAVATRTPPETLRGLGIPTLVIGSTEDELFPPHLLQQVADAVGGRFALIPEAGHSAYFERPDDWTTAYQAFLDHVDHLDD